jgi:hypothetical protein
VKDLGLNEELKRLEMLLNIFTDPTKIITLVAKDPAQLDLEKARAEEATWWFQVQLFLNVLTLFKDFGRT